MEIIRGTDIENALKNEYRQYLTGRLQKPQPFLEHIGDDIEVGISDYRQFTADTPHVHPVCTEHGYVLKGKLKVLLLDGSGTEYEFREGDYFVTRPGTPYASKSEAGTRILFIKHPSENDKQALAVDGSVMAWLSAWENAQE